MVDTMDDLDYMLPANCPNPYFDSWDRHNSIAFSATKGLRNAPGENNCFVNCAVQVLWHLDVFRRSYRRMLGHTCMGNSCIFCALKVIFTQFQYSDKAALHPDALRKALAETFANQHRFQLGHMDDAAECFENILRRIHFHIASSYSEDACTAPHCLPHQKFAMNVHEKVVCPCGASSSPLKFSEMVHYVSASALVAQTRMMQESGDMLHPDRFGLLLRKAASMGDVRDCPAMCGRQIQKQRTLLNVPDVVSVGLVWDSDRPSTEMTTEVASCLGTIIHLQDMFHCVMPDIRCLPRLQLVAVVCYYGKHYSTFVFHSKLRTWVYFDDATVREIGPQWENVVEKCSKGRFQPLLLLYANPGASPVPVDTAPHKRVMAPGYAPVPAMTSNEIDCGLNRTHESIKSIQLNPHRSVTSNMDPQAPADVTSNNHFVTSDGSSSTDSGRDSPGRLSREHARQPSFLIAVTGKNEKNRLLHGGASSPLPPSGIIGNCPGRELPGGITKTVSDSRPSNDDCASYTLSGGDQYRRPYMNGLDTSQLPMPPNMSRHNPDVQHRENFKRNGAGPKEKGGVDIIRYQVDPSRTLNNHTPDFTLHQSQADFHPIQRAENDHGNPKAPVVFNVRQQSNYAGHLDKTVASTGELTSNGQHVVLKPKPTGHGHCDAVDGHGHSPVQSGLATLPRNKGQNGVVDVPSHQRQSSGHQEVAQITRQTSMGNLTLVGNERSIPPGTPPPEYQKLDPHHQYHSRQTSVSSQGSMIKSSASMGHIEQSISSLMVTEDKPKKKAKKDPKEKKSGEKDASKKSDRKKPSSKLDSTSKRRGSDSDVIEEDMSSYIDRQKVESVLKQQGLKHQGVHRTNSSCSNNSSSSLESDSLMGRLLATKAAESSFDSISLGSHKDSGYGSSDRNSSSSTGSGTIDPYAQYFISKSMVIPRSVNTQMLDCTQDYSKAGGEHYLSQSFGPQHFKNLSGSTTEVSRHGSTMLSGCKVMHPIRESSQEDLLRGQPQQEKDGSFQKVAVAPFSTQNDMRPPPVPPKNFAQFQIIRSAQTTHPRDTSLDSLDKDASGSEQFDALCKKGDALMDSCMLAETRDDFPSAISFCNCALGCLKEAMSLKDLSNKALAYVQKRHNSCLVKLRSLQKRATVRQESSQSAAGPSSSTSGSNRSSITSSDSDTSDHHAHLHKRHSSWDPLDVRSVPTQPVNQRDLRSTPSVHEHQDSFSYRQQIVDSQQVQLTNDTFVKNGGMAETNQSLSQTRSGISSSQEFNDSGFSAQQKPDTSGMPMSHSGNCLVAYTGGVENGENSVDVYGTLPRNKSRKPTSDMPTNPELYQSFLNKQKCLQAGVSASQQSLDSLKSDSSGSDHCNTGANTQQKLSKAEIRQLLQDNLVQRQWHPQQQQSQSLIVKNAPSQQNGLSAHPNQQKPVMQQTQPGNPTRQQQQQHQQQQHQLPGQLQATAAGLTTPAPAVSIVQTGVSQPVSQLQAPVRGLVPSQKPSIPYPSSVTKARPPGPLPAARPATTNQQQGPSEMPLSGLILVVRS
ncbi:uncharacterized protein LOC112557623 isoform X6 [Pomacea canaliculata]|uniref:uncharacterized protein LOC112557623 isoform X6 n=1 Tax=Pomacea canaliculata TaxID=400727 RepID=UPI000D72D422|nr:uncharacterized protein LOC112557623 isoform X6 [Pomacea canaliculata]